MEKKEQENQFAKLFQTETHQVLVKKEVSKEAGEFNFSASIWHEGNEFRQAYGYEDDFDRDAAYDMFDMGMAKQFVTAMASFISFTQE